MKVIYLQDDHWIFGNFDAKNYGPVTFIKNKYKDDKGLHIHEETHYKQWKRNPILMPILYYISQNYRLNYEIEAYVNELLCYDESIHNRLMFTFITFLRKNYKIKKPYNHIFDSFNKKLNYEIHKRKLE